MSSEKPKTVKLTPEQVKRVENERARLKREKQIRETLENLETPENIEKALQNRGFALIAEIEETLKLAKANDEARDAMQPILKDNILALAILISGKADSFDMVVKLKGKDDKTANLSREFKFYKNGVRVDPEAEAKKQSKLEGYV
jgi:hypothetical protein